MVTGGVYLSITLQKRGASDELAKARLTIPLPKHFVRARASNDTPSSPAIDPKERAKALREVDDHTDAKSLFRLGRAYEDEPRDLVKARALFERAAALGDPEALNRAGFYAQYGLGGPVDAAVAADRYERAAKGGYAEAYAALAKLYTDGRLMAPDLERASDYIEKGIAAGSIESLFMKGAALIDAKGDSGAALSYLRQASEGGSANAQLLVSHLYKDGKILAQSDADALAWAQLAAESGSIAAQTDFARLLLSTNGSGQQVTKEANDALDTARAGGSGRATLDLAQLPLMSNSEPPRT